jgi:hypothetical protein
VASTLSNEHSSRSHCIASVYVTSTASSSSSSATLHLVDLAGSERIKKSGSTGEQLKEAQVSGHQPIGF